MAGAKILVCEDEYGSHKAISDILNKKGYEVYGAVDGQDAIEKAKEIGPDLILMDIRMPKIDGLEAAREIRRNDAGVKIIFLTAFKSPELSLEANKYDISDYIIKPASPELILESVSRALSEN